MPSKIWGLWDPDWSCISESGSPSFQNLHIGSITESENRRDSIVTCCHSRKVYSVDNRSSIFYVKDNIQHENSPLGSNETMQYVTNEKQMSIISCSQDKRKET